MGLSSAPFPRELSHGGGWSEDQHSWREGQSATAGPLHQKAELRVQGAAGCTILFTYAVMDPSFFQEPTDMYIYMGFLWGAGGEESTCQRRRHKRCGFSPWFGKIPWRRAWQPTPVFLPREAPWTEEPGGLQSTGS